MTTTIPRKFQHQKREKFVDDTKKEISFEKPATPCRFTLAAGLLFNQDNNAIVPKCINNIRGFICRHKDGTTHFIEAKDITI